MLLSGSSFLIQQCCPCQVLIASGLPSDSAVPSSLTIDTPSSINAPNAQQQKGCTENSQASSVLLGTDITLPAPVQKQPLSSATSAGGMDGNLPQKKKRKPWSKAEDLELIAAVEKCGEGNWANILKGDFKGDRTASQLSQVLIALSSTLLHAFGFIKQCWF